MWGCLSSTPKEECRLWLTIYSEKEYLLTCNLWQLLQRSWVSTRKPEVPSMWLDGKIAFSPNIRALYGLVLHTVKAHTVIREAPSCSIQSLWTEASGSLYTGHMPLLSFMLQHYADLPPKFHSGCPSTYSEFYIVYLSIDAIWHMSFNTSSTCDVFSDLFLFYVYCCSVCLHVYVSVWECQIS